MVVVFSVTLGIDKTKIQKLKTILVQMNHTCFLFLWSPELIRWALALPLPWFLDLAAREQNTIQLIGRYISHYFMSWVFHLTHLNGWRQNFYYKTEDQFNFPILKSFSFVMQNIISNKRSLFTFRAERLTRHSLFTFKVIFSQCLHS